MHFVSKLSNHEIRTNVLWFCNLYEYKVQYTLRNKGRKSVIGVLSFQKVHIVLYRCTLVLLEYTFVPVRYTSVPLWFTVVPVCYCEVHIYTFFGISMHLKGLVRNKNVLLKRYHPNTRFCTFISYLNRIIDHHLNDYKLVNKQVTVVLGAGNFVSHVRY